MMWVKEILPPRPRFRWLFMTRRLSATSLAGMSRTLVAVGTWRLASMFATVRAAAPLSGTISSDSTGTAGGVVVTAAATGAAAAAGAAGSGAALVTVGAAAGAALVVVPLLAGVDDFPFASAAVAGSAGE